MRSLFRPRRRWLTLLLLATLGSAVAYSLLARRYVAAALASTSIVRSYESISIWYPGRATLRGLVLSQAANQTPHWVLSIDRVELQGRHWLAGRELLIRVPQQTASLRAGSLAGEVQLSAELTLSDLRDPKLKQAQLVASARSLPVAGQAARDLELRLQLAPQADSATAATTHWRLAAHGGNAGPLFAALDAEAALQWMFPQALDAPFQLNSRVSLTPSRIALEELRLRCGALALTGAVRWSSSTGRSGALLVTSPLRMGLSLEPRSARPELAPAPGWLERTLRQQQTPHAQANAK